MSLVIHNVHSHVFTVRNVPRRFLPLGLVKALSKRKNWRGWDAFIRACPLFGSKEARERIASFCRAAEHESQEDILRDMMGFYPSLSRFGLLSMDFEYMGAGKSRLGFIAQLDELAAIKAAYKDLVLPFIAIDPRRPGLFELARHYIEEAGFEGFKLYPPLGYFPFDDRLGDIYAYAEEKGVPIVTHCSRAAALVHYRGEITAAMRVHPKTGARLEGKTRRAFADNWANPENYRYVLEKYPRLKLDLGHAGGAVEWRKYLDTTWPGKLLGEAAPVRGGSDTWLETVLGLIGGYENVYADVSYTAYDSALLPLLKVLLADPKLAGRFLFGSDSYMVQMDSGERRFGVGVRAFLGEELYRMIAETNPRHWLERAAPNPGH
jgi:uncharacterized protein